MAPEHFVISLSVTVHTKNENGRQVGITLLMQRANQGTAVPGRTRSCSEKSETQFGKDTGKGSGK